METSAVKTTNIDESFHLLIKEVSKIFIIEIIKNMKSDLINNKLKKENDIKLRTQDDYRNSRGSVGNKTNSSFCC